jgi:DNA-binding MarR family transcriptional regulator
MTNASQVFEPLLGAGALDKTVHEPARLMMLSILYGIDRADFVFLHKITGLTRGNFSTHMSKLEEAGYIKVDKEFVNRRPLTVLSITPAGRSALETYKESMKRILAELE